jgi:galactokinase/mevalonate kinase-like predicted kinase
MKDFLQRLNETTDLIEAKELVDAILCDVRAGHAKPDQCRLFLRNLFTNESLAASLSTSSALDHLFDQLNPEQFQRLFGPAVEKELPQLTVDLVDTVSEVSHQDLLRLVPDGHPKPLIALLKRLAEYIDSLTGSAHFLRGMRVARIQAEIYRRLDDARIWKRRSPPACALDDKQLVRLKAEKRIGDLPAAYENRVGQLQRLDLQHSLAEFTGPTTAATPRMIPEDFARSFCVDAPLRLGISSANASDNHIRSKEQGGKTLNAGLDLQVAGESEPTPPLQVQARRLPEPSLKLHSRSQGFKADFEAHRHGDQATQSELFFAYRRGGDEALRLTKQALIHSGIVRDHSPDIIRDIADFTGGGGLELTTRSKIQQGSGLGTSSILATAILKALYRLANHPAADPAHEYPLLYDASVLLEQSIGLNSGWQDARGACGGPSAVKDFYAPPTQGLPSPERRFIEIDQALFAERVVLFDTGISRAATRGLNVVMDTYLARTPGRYGAIRESLVIHDEMVGALTAGDYPALGRLATRYWQLRCILDPEATNSTIQHIFEAPQLRDLSEGGLVTGAGGGGFALLIARDGAAADLVQRLQRLKQAAYAQSAVVQYRLNPTGIRLTEE